MKRIAIASCSLCVVLAAIYFYQRKDKKPVKTPIEVKVDKKLDIKRDQKVVPEVSKDQDSEAKKSPQREETDEKLTDKEVETPEQKKIKKSVVKRNKFYKNSDIEVVNIDKVSNRSSVIIRTKHEGQNYSFSALIDNETGKIIKTWGRTIFERRK